MFRILQPSLKRFCLPSESAKGLIFVFPSAFCARFTEPPLPPARNTPGIHFPQTHDAGKAAVWKSRKSLNSPSFLISSEKIPIDVGRPISTIWIGEEKSHLSPGKRTCAQVVLAMGKLWDLGYELLGHPLFSSFGPLRLLFVPRLEEICFWKVLRIQ
ncbi:hypothetical protein CDAR_384781 [Caerostris darwini]|uniref:Uncharacterized protein n=1 Tax=Caerostris darwini TaxID=1538125 RepID=A0AAV4WD88_9ARAC|nr:hypothetical protein CDAR_384781 [Caerostris darwini]